MDITLINKKNIKVSLTKEELALSGISIESMDYSDIRTKRFIWNILEKAHSMTGFDGCESKLLLRVFRSSDGGCELFVTKRSENNEKSKADDGFVCIIDNAENLYLLCEKLRSSGFCGKTSLFCDDKGKFALACVYERQLPSYISAKSFKTKESRFDFVYEYGKVYSLSDEISAYLDEHTRLLEKNNAIGRITGEIL